MRTYRTFVWSYFGLDPQPAAVGDDLAEEVGAVCSPISRTRRATGATALTMTRSVPLTMNVPILRSSCGTSPEDTSCSFMSRIERSPVSGSLSHDGRSHRELRAARSRSCRALRARPRSIASSCRPTGSPHSLQKSRMLLALYVPHLWQSTSPGWNGIGDDRRSAAVRALRCAGDAALFEVTTLALPGYQWRNRRTQVVIRYENR